MNTMTLIRSFLATGDRRCPLVCVWTLTPSPAADEPERTLPALWSRLLRSQFLERAISRTVTSFRYA